VHPVTEHDVIPVSVVIPAHDEAAVIERCLHALTDGAAPGELEVLIVANGCTDDTAERARRACPSAGIVELPEASKRAALDAGDARATRFPRFYVDADVELPLPAVRATVRALARPGVECAAPRPRFVLRGRPWAVRSFYDIWARQPFLRQEVVGNGVYALTDCGRSRFGAFPPVTADDQFVLQQFATAERRTVRDHAFLVHPPMTIRGLLSVRTRAYRGAIELAGSGLGTHPPVGGARRSLLHLARDPRRWPGLGVYVAINGIAMWRARRSRATPSTTWERDDSARLRAAAADTAVTHG
jgi:hypothetical protein